MQQKQETALIVKIVFKKAVFNLGKNIKAYPDLIAQIKNRFSELQNYKITFKEQPVTSQNFQDIFKSQLNQAQPSLKLELHELSAQQVTESKPTKSKKFSFDPKDFEDDKQQSEKQGKSKDLQNEFQELKLAESLKSEDKLNDIDVSAIKIKVLMGDSLSNLKKNVGEEYEWSCTFINQTSIEVPEGVYIKDLATNKLISLGGTGARQAEQIEFGPYVEKQMGKFTRVYQIVYKKNEQTLVPIGNKFGFVCEANKKLDVKELSSKVYKKITELKSFSASEKSTEYIMAKFKDMGIDDSTILKYKDEDLIDMMESFNIIE